MILGDVIMNLKSPEQFDKVKISLLLNINFLLSTHSNYLCVYYIYLIALNIISI